MIRYKMDILAALKEAGYNTNRLRKEKLLAEGVIQSLREGKYIALQNIDKICCLSPLKKGLTICCCSSVGRAHPW